MTAGEVDRFREHTLAKLRGVRCPVHSQTPRVSFQGSTLRDVSIQMSACCGQLIRMANRAIAAPRRAVHDDALY